ncbi:MAG: hypothetical protein RMK18_10985 [Armatimonadota bacterium]|nr:hypothetical protein [Armatimonadota bacterium]MCX7778376.1 hypothetical protein [Armatimonadota bacterium]MDW8026371.1 hypothetical protein [Armatimonadota bacterium]
MHYDSGYESKRLKTLLPKEKICSGGFSQESFWKHSQCELLICSGLKFLLLLLLSPKSFSHPLGIALGAGACA